MAFWNRNKQAVEESGRDVLRGNDGIEQAGRVCNQGLSTVYQLLSIYLVRPAAFLCFQGPNGFSYFNLREKGKPDGGKALISVRC